MPCGAAIATFVPRTGLESLAMVTTDEMTSFDPQDRTSWYIDDAIVRLRLWGTERASRAPSPEGEGFDRRLKSTKGLAAVKQA